VELLVELTKVNIPKDILNNFKHPFMAEGGNDYQIAEAKKILTVGEIYTLKSVRIESYSTTFVLEEFPDNAFNSSLFFGVINNE
jgi:hypothetical protein